MNKTYLAKKGELQRQWFVVDAKDKILGRLASKVAVILRGKHKPTFSPHQDSGDGVIVINAAKIRVTGRKLKNKVYLRYSGYQGGQRSVTLENMLAKRPTTVLRLAIQRMLPSGRLGSGIIKKLRIYANDRHPHQVQKAQILEI